jgi:hypothetical protein
VPTIPTPFVAERVVVAVVVVAVVVCSVTNSLRVGMNGWFAIGRSVEHAKGGRSENVNIRVNETSQRVKSMHVEMGNGQHNSFSTERGSGQLGGGQEHSTTLQSRRRMNARSVATHQSRLDYRRHASTLSLCVIICAVQSLVGWRGDGGWRKRWENRRDSLLSLTSGIVC